jgi:DNA-binding CsgD family transcriptional regulator
MLDKDISNIICFVQSGGVSAGEPTCALAGRLLEAEQITRTHLLVYDFELNSLFFANTGASSLLGVEKIGLKEYNGSFLESIIHPVSYQFLLYNTRLLKPSAESFDGVFYLKTNGKAKYTWVCASVKVAGFTQSGIPKLIYICFVEVERAMECYIRVATYQSDMIGNGGASELISSLNSREVEMLNLVASERTSKEIADILNLSQSAVDSARKRLIKKLKVKSVVGLVKAAMALRANGHDVLLPAEVR